MTTQDLKNNRNEILGRISEIANTSYTKEIMQKMLSLVEASIADSDNVIDLVDEVVELNEKYNKTSIVDVQNFFNDNSEKMMKQYSRKF